MIPDQLKIQPGQEALTPEQEVEAQRFAQERIAAQLSTKPVDEPEAERLLRHAYEVARLPPPEHIRWVDGPLELLAVLGLPNPDDSVVYNRWAQVRYNLRASVWDRIRTSIGASVEARLDHISWDRVAASVEQQVGDHLRASLMARVEARLRVSVKAILGASISAYAEAALLACFHFYHVYLAPNEFHVLIHFNEQVSGYWLGQEGALLVRRPRVLARDQEGRLHSATGKCVEYHDGWGISAWHGVVVPERVILAPERLSREDFLNEPNVEVRRVIQERMGQRFVPELGVVIDSEPRGILYEVQLPSDPRDRERVARYVQVQDASTPRQYFLRVPPTIQTAAEGVAWSFQVGVEDYHPTQET